MRGILWPYAGEIPSGGWQRGRGCLGDGWEGDKVVGGGKVVGEGRGGRGGRGLTPFATQNRFKPSSKTCYQ